MSGAKASLLVSRRGQITLPVDVRKRLGIREGGVVTLEQRGGDLILRPAAVVDVEMYSDEDIARWDKEDRLTRTAKQRIRGRLLRKR